MSRPPNLPLGQTLTCCILTLGQHRLSAERHNQPGCDGQEEATTEKIQFTESVRLDKISEVIESNL